MLTDDFFLFFYLIARYTAHRFTVDLKCGGFIELNAYVAALYLRHYTLVLHMLPLEYGKECDKKLYPESCVYNYDRYQPIFLPFIVGAIQTWLNSFVTPSTVTFAPTVWNPYNTPLSAIIE